MKRKLICLFLLLLAFSLLLSSCDLHSHSFTVNNYDDNNHYRECECGEPNVEAHQYTAEVIKEPTCKIEGEQKLTCTICSYSKIEPIEKIEHTIERTEAVEPTCISDGKTMGERCSVCFTRITSVKKIDRLPHNFVDNVCTSCGTKKGSDGLEYSEYKGIPNAVQVRYSGGDLTEIVVPEYNEDGKKVVSVGRFNGWEILKKVTLPDTIEEINQYAFYDCHVLEEVVIPDSVTRIGVEAFKNCYLLKKINIPEGVTVINESTFENCYALESVEIKGELTEIGTEAFKDCELLEALDIPETTIVHHPAFSNCSFIKKVVIPEGTTTINPSAFKDYIALEELILPDSLQTLPNLALDTCPNLKTVVLPRTVGISHHPIRISLPLEFFKNCKKLESVTLPENITSIDIGTFSGCTSLKTIEIPEGVTSISGYAFLDCTSLETVILPESLTFIGGFAFKNSALTSIDIPENVTTINEGTFEGCDFEEFTIPEKMIEIPSSLLRDNSKLKKVVLHDKVVTIGSGAFRGCLALEDINIPESVKVIGGGAFAGSGIKKFVLPKTMTTVPYNLFDGSALTEIILHENVRYFDEAAFSGSKLTEVKIPKLIESLGNWYGGEFEGCKELKKVTFEGDAVHTIIDNAFSYSGLESFVCPDSVTNLGGWAFQKCEDLEYVMLSKNLERLGLCAFNDCPKLEILHYNGTVEEFSKVRVSWGELTEFEGDTRYKGSITQVQCTDGIFELVRPEQ